MNAHLPYQFLCGHLHAVLCMGQKIQMHWIIPATRTNLPWMCKPHGRYKVFLLSGLCCCILHESRKEEYQLKYCLNICYLIIKSWLSVARIFCTGHCMDVLLLVTVTTYKMRCMDLVDVIFFFVCALEGFGNPWCNRRIRMWITEQNYETWNGESEQLVCIGASVKKFEFVFMQSKRTKVCVCVWERLIN
jgi:uncharacterized membrane protein